MYFTEEPEHIRMLRDSLQKFAQSELQPAKIRQWERERHYPKEEFAKLADLGVCGLTVDEEYGGMGRDIVAAIAVLEELGRAGALAGQYIHCAFYGGMNISEKGSQEQKAELLPKLGAGKLLFAYGLSEPNIGADLVVEPAWLEGHSRKPDCHSHGQQFSLY